MPARRSIICSTARRRRKATSSAFRRSAQTLKTIAAKGARAFYEGELADDMAQTIGAKRLVHRRRGFRQSSRRHRHADFDQLSKASTSSRSRRTGRAWSRWCMLNILEHFDVAALDPLRAGAFPSDAGSGAHRLRRARHAHRRRRAYAHAGRRPARQGLCQEARRPDRHEQARAVAESAGAEQRHDLSQRRRPRPHRGVVHQLAVFRLRPRRLHREDRHHADQSRRLLHARARSSEHLRPGQAADAHHHSRHDACATAAAT